MNGRILSLWQILDRLRSYCLQLEYRVKTLQQIITEVSDEKLKAVEMASQLQKELIAARKALSLKNGGEKNE